MRQLAEELAEDAERNPRPARRPVGVRPLAPRPTNHTSRHPSFLRRRVLDVLCWTNRLLRRLPPGAWLAERLHATRVFSAHEARMARGREALDGLRIAFVSDLHAGGFLDGRDLLRLFEKVAALEPDLVCLGGDLIEASIRDLALFEEALALARPPLGIFAVPGNHEYLADPTLDACRDAFEALGVTLLVNAGRRIARGGASLWLAGVDDLSLGRPNLAAALAGADPEEPILLLSHHPDMFVEASHAGVELTLAGHTHAGQVVIRGRSLWRHSRLGYHEGWFEREGARLYVGRGGGVTCAPFRLGTTPEVPILELRTDARRLGGSDPERV